MFGTNAVFPARCGSQRVGRVLMQVGPEKAFEIDK